MYHLKYLFFNLQLFDPLLVVLITLMRHLHVTVINSFNVCMSQRGVATLNDIITDLEAMG